MSPNEISKAITVESQDATGSVSPIAETYDLVFTTSSPTGEFVTSTGKKLSTTTTMRTGTGNRTVYYEDSSLGNFLLAVTATARTSKETFTIAQHIIVANPAQVVPVVPTVKTQKLSPTPTVPTTQKVVTSGTVAMATTTATTTASQTADVLQATFVAPVHTDFLHRVFAWPIALCDSIYRFFFGE